MEPKETIPQGQENEKDKQGQFKVEDDRFYYETSDGEKIYWEYDTDGNRME